MPNDPRIRAFLDRAAAVVAASKGLTVECQQQLEVLATQLRLEPEQWQQCLDELKNQTNPERTYSRYEQAFLDAAGKNLASIAGRILSLGKEQLLLELAANKFQIGQVRAHQLLETCCEDLDIRRISRTDTEASFREFAVNLIGSARRAPPEVISQLTDAGKGWGLTGTEVRTIVNHVVVANGRRRMRRFSRAAKLILLFFTVAGIIAWSANLINRLGQREPSKLDGGAHGATGVELPKPDWFPAEKLDELLGSLDNSRQLDELSNRLAKESTDDRAITYGQIAELALSPFGAAPADVAGLLNLLVGSDPDREKIMDWEKEFLDELESRLQSIPASDGTMRRALRLADLAAQLERSSEIGDSGSSIRFELAGLNQTKLGGNGPAGLLLGWWAQLVYQEPPPVAKAIAVTALLHQFSLQYLPETLSNQWRQQLIARVIQADSASTLKFGEELRNAILQSGESEIGMWIQLWRQLKSAPCRDLIGKLVLQRTHGDQPTGPVGSIESEMHALSNEIIQRRFAGILQLNIVADRSLELARMLQLNPAEEPISIALTAQAVNDALQVILQLDNSRGEQPFQEKLPSIWRFDPSTAEPMMVEPELNRIAPQATPANFRTFDEAMAEINLAGKNPERGGYRRLALEELQRVAPRMDDIPAKAASELATWFLQEMPVEEWLAVEKSLPAFRFWPTLGLALSDRIASLPINIDQAISIAQLIADPKFRLEKSGDWRNKCSRAIAENVVQILESRLLSMDSKNSERWQRTRFALARIYTARCQILGHAQVDSDSQPMPSIQAVRLAWPGHAVKSLDDPELQSALGIADGNELEITVQAAAISAGKIGEDLKVLLPSEERWNGFSAGDRLANGAPARLGNQLLAIESELLQYLTLIRKNQVNRLTAELP